MHPYPIRKAFYLHIAKYHGLLTALPPWSNAIGWPLNKKQAWIKKLKNSGGIAHNYSLNLAYPLAF
jgi:hypothetical protein